MFCTLWNTGHTSYMFFLHLETDKACPNLWTMSYVIFLCWTYPEKAEVLCVAQFLYLWDCWLPPILQTWLNLLIWDSCFWTCKCWISNYNLCLSVNNNNWWYLSYILELRWVCWTHPGKDEILFVAHFLYFQGSTNIRSLPEPELLEFVLDDYLRKSIKDAKRNFDAVVCLFA